MTVTLISVSSEILKPKSIGQQGLQLAKKQDPPESVIPNAQGDKSKAKSIQVFYIVYSTNHGSSRRSKLLRCVFADGSGRFGESFLDCFFLQSDF
jgi:hypothetical protein